MPIVVTPIYAGLLALLYVFLSFRVIRHRRGARINLGDGGNAEMQRRMRVHGNFAEYVPLALILMFLAEWLDQSLWIIHVMGVLLLAGRSAHAVGVSRDPQIMPLRVAGMASTIATLILGAIANLSGALV
jgi:hypothetical protein